VAHTDGLVMCGIGSVNHVMLGVDVERLGRRTNPELADRYFSAPEADYLRTRLDDADRCKTFLRIWTLKESFIKAIGTGLATPLADFAFENIESSSPTIRMLNPDLESDFHWKFFSIEPRPGFVGAIAVACQRESDPVTLDLKSFDDLIGGRSPRQ
ncbi:MAG: 4'-phosphopantetheinyl transferase superfamily protein, partial [Pirellulales bacterium]|nr:4'-phosphopantetheinyl transferase superfamily protein [Pirellulales bacterium]